MPEMDNRARSVSSNLRIGLSKPFPNPGKDLSTSLDKFIKQKSNLVKKDQSQSTVVPAWAEQEFLLRLVSPSSECGLKI